MNQHLESTQTATLDGTPAEPPWRPLPARPASLSGAVTLSTRRARRWALTLEARQIPCRTEKHGFGWQVLVPAESFERALVELRQYETENRNWPPPLPPEVALADNRLPTVSVLLLVATFFNLTQLQQLPFDLGSPAWVELGNADAGAIRNGEWWRLFTALTLHADWLHLFGNLTIGGVFIVRLCRDLGSGLGWSLLLASGVLGNLLNAWVQQPLHRAVGASTAVFGAVGLLAALSLLRYRTSLRRRWFLPLAAAVALLALLGSEGVNTDIGAHLFGFAAGALLGVGSELLLARCGRPRPFLNRLLALLSLLLVGLAWGIALTAS